MLPEKLQSDIIKLYCDWLNSHEEVPYHLLPSQFTIQHVITLPYSITEKTHILRVDFGDDGGPTTLFIQVGHICDKDLVRHEVIDFIVQSFDDHADIVYQRD